MASERGLLHGCIKFYGMNKGSQQTKQENILLPNRELTSDIPSHKGLPELKLHREDGWMNSWSNNTLRTNELRQWVWLRVLQSFEFLRSRGLFWHSIDVHSVFVSSSSGIC